MQGNPVKVLVQVALSCFTGYGSDGLGLINALEAAGCDVYIKPAHVDPPLPQNIANLLTKRLSADPPFDLLIDHQDPGAMGVTPEGRRATKLAVGITMWEYSSLDNMQGKDRKTLRKRIKEMDLLLGYDPVSTECLREYLPKRGKAPALGTLQGGFEVSKWKYVNRNWNSQEFNFCMVGALHSRKDPFVAIQAFKELKDEKGEAFSGGRLNLKTNIPGLHSEMERWCPGLKIYYDVWSEEVLRNFYAQQHMLLAPSRGEGKHLPALEFQSTGGVVAATNWGGPTMWLNSEYAFPINYELMPISGASPNCKNARASKEHLKEIMWYAYTHRSEMRERGELAARIIPVSHSWDSVVDRLFNKVGELPKGEEVYNKFILGKPRESDDE